MIEVNNLTKYYGDHAAVDHLSFTVEDGQIYGFLGPNGAGKSTTLNILTGYLAATEGTVLVDGHDIAREPEAARRAIGYLPEIPPLYPDMTVGEYLDFCAELKKLPAAERQNAVAQAVALTHLEEMERRLIRNLSKGYRQRVGLAQAILGFPKLIILDEPTVGLDPKQMLEIRELIRELAKSHTVLLSSHILSEVRAICDHILILHHGKLVACDTPENLEAQLTGGSTIDLTVKASAQTATDILEGVAGVTGYRVTPHPEGATLSVTASGDIREALFFAFADARCAILELHPHLASLEEVFLELTDSDLSEDGAEAENGEDGEVPEIPEVPAEIEAEEAPQNESNL
ncbi:MAG: ABC transporter ATP-binding protein [Oscillospiraceae bacterium]